MKKWLVCTAEQIPDAEGTVFARFLRYVISKRNGTYAWNTVANRDFDITSLSDSELTPENGFPILYRYEDHIRKDGQGQTTQILGFKEITGGNFASSFDDTHYQVDADAEGNKTMTEVPTAPFLDGVDYVEWTETKPEFKEI
jgi:hypothetical protein